MKELRLFSAPTASASATERDTVSYSHNRLQVYSFYMYSFYMYSFYRCYSLSLLIIAQVLDTSEKSDWDC